MTSKANHLLSAHAEAIEAHLEAVVPRETEEPRAVHTAMRHALFAGGKRLRPALALMSAEAAGCDPPARALPVGAALEMIHTYSLIHDDLPCMDDDELRRGQPTVHVAHGEAMAVLAGDALLTLAFGHLGEAAARADLPASTFPRIVATLARGAGTPHGMVAGQVADIEGEENSVDAAGLEFIHQRKTGALIEAACICGALVAEPPEEVVESLGAYGRALGLAFQIVDDILDVTASSDALGKTAGKDAEQGKATYVALHGIDAAREEARRQGTLAQEALASLGDRGEDLRALAEFVVSRDC